MERVVKWMIVFACLPFAAAGAASSSESQPAQSPPQKMNHAYIKLFQAVPNGAWEDTSQKRLEFIARNYFWINSHAGSWLKGSKPTAGVSEGLAIHDNDVDWRYFAGPSAGRDANGKTVGERLRDLNPKIILTNYRNGAYTNQNALKEAGEIEKNLPMGIAVFNTHTTLTKPVAKKDTTIILNPPEKVPAGVPAIYPFKASTTSEKYTKDKKDYVAWLRLDNEIMRINKATAEGGKIVLEVERGYWGTKTAKHGQDAVVLQPVYNGSGRNGKEYGLSGLPDGSSPQRGLRYVMNQSRPEFWKFLASKSKECIEEGYNGPWFDCTASTWINQSNAYGVSVKDQGPWDPDLKRDLDHETYREYQQRKIDYMFKHFPESEFYVNWFFPQTYFNNGTDKLLFSGENGHHPISGGAIEMYANPGNMEWKPLMAMQIDMRDNHYRTISWVKAANMSPQYMLYAYGTHLMIHEPGAEQYWGREGDPFQPNEFLFWDLGKPLQHFKSIDEAELKATPGVYARDFMNGRVLVNPDKKKSHTVSLKNVYYETESKSWVSKVVLKPQSAALLLNPAPARKTVAVRTNAPHKSDQSVAAVAAANTK